MKMPACSNRHKAVCANSARRKGGGNQLVANLEAKKWRSLFRAGNILDHIFCWAIQHIARSESGCFGVYKNEAVSPSNSDSPNEANDANGQVTRPFAWLAREGVGACVPIEEGFEGGGGGVCPKGSYLRQVWPVGTHTFFPTLPPHLLEPSGAPSNGALEGLHLPGMPLGAGRTVR